MVSSPMPSMPTVTVERSRRKICGSREYPAPPGLPVEMRVPGKRVTDSDSLWMSVATDRTIWPVLASCTVCPSTTVQMCRSCGSGISSAVTTNGPVG